MMPPIDPARWLAAVKATEWHRSQVQSFLYRVEGAAEKRAGAHVIRDCTLDWGKQEIFRQVDLTGERYEEITAQQREIAELYETCIVINEYNCLSAPAYGWRDRVRTIRRGFLAGLAAPLILLKRQ